MKRPVSHNFFNPVPSLFQTTVNQRWSFLLKLFILSILFAVIANAIAYIHLSRPDILQGLWEKVNSLLPKQAEEPVPPVE